MRKSIVFFYCLAFVAAACARSDSPSAPDPASPSSSAVSSTPTSVSPSPSPMFDGRLVKLTYRAGVVDPKGQEIEVRLGERVSIEIDSDRADELHVHAYDKKVDVVSGQTSALEFIADIPGKFEVELEKSKVTLFELKVQ
ncbi:MAG TPA: hypothetical protein VNA87_05175 [Actinomycetota bacterium]|nr:hypothetical protein [Actinomycetota bacterium]